MEALILAGGFGTRLRPLTLHTPKELLPIAGKPEIDYLLENLARHGIRKITISVNNVFADAMRAYIGAGRQWGFKSVDFVVEHTGSEDKKLGAVGALEFVGRHLHAHEDVLIIGADNFSPRFDFTRMEISHRASGCEITIGLHKFPHKEMLPTLGVAEILPSGRILRFHEKPANPPSDLISTAIYIVAPDFFTEAVPDFVESRRVEGKKPDNLGDIWEHMLREGNLLNSYVSTEFWIDIGKPQGYFMANEFILKKTLAGKSKINSLATVGKGVKANGGTIVEQDAIIGDDVVLDGANHVMTGAVVGAGTVLHDCLVFPKAKIEQDCRLRNCIIPEGTFVRRGTELSGEHRIVSGQA